MSSCSFSKNRGSILLLELEPLFPKKDGSYDTGHFSLKRGYRICFFRGSGAMLSLSKAICQLSAENIAATARRHIFNDIVTPHMSKFSNLSKRKYEGTESTKHSDYTVLELIIMMLDNQR